MGTNVSNDQLDSLLRDDVRMLRIQARNAASSGPSSAYDQRPVVFPGSFNPLHIGHREMADYAQRVLRSDVTFELSIANVDKPDLPPHEIRRRLAQFDQRHTVYLTRAPRFTEKAAIFPSGQFIVGADTIIRIGDERYYEHQTQLRDAAIEQLHDLQIRFLVFGRIVNGKYEAAHQLPLPNRLKNLCIAVSETDFRRDISSTQLRGA